MTAPQERDLASAPIRLLVVEAYAVVAQALVEHLGALPDLDVIGRAETVAAAEAQIAELHPHVVIMDSRLPDGSGLELCRRLPTLSPGTRCVIHTGTHVDATEAQEAGASSVVLKELLDSGLVAAIRQAADEANGR